MDLHLRTRNLFIKHTTTTAPTTSPSFHEFVSVFYIPALFIFMLIIYMIQVNRIKSFFRTVIPIEDV